MSERKHELERCPIAPKQYIWVCKACGDTWWVGDPDRAALCGGREYRELRDRAFKKWLHDEDARKEPFCFPKYEQARDLIAERRRELRASRKKPAGKMLGTVGLCSTGDPALLSALSEASKEARMNNATPSEHNSSDSVTNPSPIADN